MQVRLRIGRLTLGLTVADRWECSQATGLPAWRHQDLHITANRATRYHGHSNSRTCIQVLVQAGPGCKNMYTATRGASVSRFVVKNSPSLRDGLMTLNIQMHISWRAEKQAIIWVNRRVNTLWTERQTTPRSG